MKKIYNSKKKINFFLTCGPAAKTKKQAVSPIRKKIVAPPVIGRSS